MSSKLAGRISCGGATRGVLGFSLSSSIEPSDGEPPPFSSIDVAGTAFGNSDFLDKKGTDASSGVHPILVYSFILWHHFTCVCLAPIPGG